MATVADVAAYLSQLAPPHLAAPWDNTGLLLGDDTTDVQRIVTCLTVTPESAAEAIAEQAQLIVTHHPIFFRPVQRLTTATPEGRTLLALARAGVAVYAPHTAFDDAVGGINDQLAGRLGLLDVGPLRPRPVEAQCKIVVFVPESDLARVSDALFAAGAGQIGEYRECSFRVAGTGTFFGSEASHPTVGSKGRREEVSEWRLEAICPEAIVEQVVAAMRRAHSYEEPAYDVYPLRSLPGRGGQGRLGRLPQPLALDAFARHVKAALGGTPVQVAGSATRLVQSVALACGAAGEFLSDAVQRRADVFLTGEARFHDCLSAQAQGIALVLAGHYATERLGVEHLAELLRRQFSGVQVWASRRETEPLWTV
ncbi:MAG: Nif3-like dinuclear metal center hexameric protein [Gemmataceae bacterium]|nr:Nif3-like dinuclear metal center hexameric protein [Gemmataceae bacterium]